MEQLRLVRPSMEYGSEIMAFRGELLAANDADSFAGCGSLEKYETAEEWIDLLAQMGSADACPRGMVPSDIYLAVRNSDGRAVGIIDLRHHIDHPVLGVWGGHIGYSVRPSERGKGYGKEMLRLALQKYQERGINRIMITCSRTNPASEKVIRANGGVFEKEVHADDEMIKRFWITL